MREKIVVGLELLWMVGTFVIALALLGWLVYMFAFGIHDYQCNCPHWEEASYEQGRTQCVWGYLDEATESSARLRSEQPPANGPDEFFLIDEDRELLRYEDSYVEVRGEVDISNSSIYMWRRLVDYESEDDFGNIRTGGIVEGFSLRKCSAPIED